AKPDLAVVLAYPGFPASADCWRRSQFWVEEQAEWHFAVASAHWANLVSVGVLPRAAVEAPAWGSPVAQFFEAHWDSLESAAVVVSVATGFPVPAGAES